MCAATKRTSHFEKPVPGHQAFGDGVKYQMSCPKVNRVQLELQEVRQDLFNHLENSWEIIKFIFIQTALTVTHNSSETLILKQIGQTFFNTQYLP